MAYENATSSTVMRNGGSVIVNMAATLLNNIDVDFWSEILKYDSVLCLIQNIYRTRRSESSFSDVAGVVNDIWQTI